MKSVMDVHVLKEGQKYDQSFSHQRIALSQVATFAQSLINSMGMQPNVMDGSNPDGTPRYRLMTETEIVTRSVTIAELAFAEFERREWSRPIPAFETMLQEPQTRAGFTSK